MISRITWGAASGQIAGPLAHTGSMAGFYNTTPVVRPPAYTLTFATKARTLPANTAIAVGTTGALNVGVLYAYATQAQADAIPVAINALLADLDATKKVLAQAIGDLQSVGLLQ
jgi:hypothetical protein